MLEIKKKDLLIDIFPSINELYKYCKNTPRRSTARKESEKTDDIEWYGTKNIEEAYNKFVYGDEELYKKILEQSKKIKIDKLLGNTYSRNRPFNDVVGFQADVPAYLKGIPKNMINTKPIRRSQKILNICLNFSVNAGVSAKRRQEAGIVYANVIDVLEKMGYRCNLYVVCCVEYLDEYSYCVLKVKNDREPFNLKKLAFIFGNASYHRRIVFRWRESCNVDKDMTADGGYGSTLTDKSIVKNQLEKYLKINLIVWNVQENYTVNVENVLENLKESGIKLEV